MKSAPTTPNIAMPNTALGKLFSTILIAGVLSALALAPFAAAAGWAVSSSADTMHSNLQDITNEDTIPLTTTVTDRDGTPIAWVYDQRRYDIPGDKISKDMKDSIVAIEDRRFYEHSGVDVRGTLRAAIANFTSGGVAEGASTLNQQYVKNYLYLIDAESDAERQAAIETSIPRKLREMGMASDLNDSFSKEEILTRYLNLVAFGRGAYGVESAARTFFGTHADKLNVAQSALLAGVVQSTSALDPYSNPDGAKARRNDVLQARVNAGTLTQAEADKAKAEPLGLRDKPGGEANGCIGADNAGFFCDYVLEWLQNKGMSMKDIARGGYTIRTTLDPKAQQAAHAAAETNVRPTEAGVSEASTLISPTKEGHEVVAMASSRTYGLDTKNQETVNPVTHSLQGHGAGSIFKIFTAALALEDGMGLNTVLGVPSRVEVEGLGHGGAKNCPATKYCVENASSYQSSMTLREALATSPNTPFVNLLKEVGVERTMDLAVKLGLRSYAEKGSHDKDTSIADFVKENKLGSFVLGPTPVNPLELSNVAASIADNGQWCEPLPVLSIKDRHGKQVEVKKTPCEQALKPEIAKALANGMGSDVSSGTAANAAASSGWSGPIAAKTGTTETSFSAAFLGFTPGLAGSTYIFNDGGTAANLCTSPVRQCAEGNLFGGSEPARSFFATSSKIIGNYGGAKLPDYDHAFDRSNNPYPSTAPSVSSGRSGSGRGNSTGGGGGTSPSVNDLRSQAEAFLNRLDSALRGR